MADFVKVVSLYFSYPFVWYAFAVGLLIALCAGLFGVVLVLKRFSFIALRNCNSMTRMS